MNDNNIRDRFKSANRTKTEGDDLGKIWSEQRRMQLEDKRLTQELEVSKRKAKSLKKQLRKHQLGTANTFISSKTNKLKSSGVSALAGRRKLLMRGGIVVLTVALIIGVFSFVQSDSETATLGDTVNNNGALPDLPKETPDFAMLFPAGGGNPEQYDIARTSPPGAEPSYTYLDRFSDDGAIFRVTQQLIPDNFELGKTAMDFQATNVIQIDNNVIYHGYSERGGVQSLLFVKDEKLVLIRSPERFSDDVWASYYLSLQ